MSNYNFCCGIRKFSLREEKNYFIATVSCNKCDKFLAAALFDTPQDAKKWASKKANYNE